MTSDTWNLKYGQIKDIKVNVPCIEEQKKIALFCTLLSTELKLSEVCNLQFEGFLSEYLR